LIVQLTGSKSTIVTMPLPEDDPKQRRPDIQMAKQILGWKPHISVSDGLAKTINYFRDALASDLKGSRRDVIARRREAVVS
jgi:nucleoside-diphosphate-sugar epimerase